MNDAVQVFSEAIHHYFERASGEAPTLNEPFERAEPPLVLAYTGVVGVSGRLRGAVYFTAEGPLLDDLLEALDESDRSEDAKTDLVGEVANAVAGYARRAAGGEFLLSLPVAVRGRPAEIAFPRHMGSRVLPLAWRGHEAYLIVCLARRGDGPGSDGPGESPLGETQPLRPFDC